LTLNGDDGHGHRLHRQMELGYLLRSLSRRRHGRLGGAGHTSSGQRMKMRVQAGDTYDPRYFY
jgi:hypothetical protein